MKKTNHVCCVRYGTNPRYSSAVVNTLFDQIGQACSNVKFYCLTEDPSGLSSYINSLPLKPHMMSDYHWNKLNFFDKDFIGSEFGDDITVMDIDQTFVGDPKKIIDIPLDHGEFLTVYRWWTNQKYGCPINGGFYKFKADDSLKYIREKYYTNPQYWSDYYYNLGEEVVPKNGEQRFVYEHVRKSHKIKLLPKEYVVKMNSTEMEKIKSLYEQRVGGQMFDGNQLNSRTVMVHYSGIRTTL